VALAAVVKMQLYVIYVAFSGSLAWLPSSWSTTLWNQMVWYGMGWDLGGKACTIVLLGALNGGNK